MSFIRPDTTHIVRDWDLEEASAFPHWAADPRVREDGFLSQVRRGVRQEHHPFGAASVAGPALPETQQITSS